MSDQQPPANPPGDVPKDSPGLAFLSLSTSQRFQAWVGTVGSEEAEAQIFDAVAGGQNLAEWTGANGFSYTTALRWIRKTRERSDAYNEARRDRAALNADKVIEVARRDCSAPVLDKEGNHIGTVVDKGKVAQARNEMDALKWHSARMDPMVWGDTIKVDQTINVREASDEQLARALGQFGLGELADKLLGGQATRLPAGMLPGPSGDKAVH
jgi:hypothetical protein